MKLSQLFWLAARLLAIPAILSTLALYNYPLVLGCAFPEPTSGTKQSSVDGAGSTSVTESSRRAPFRLLALGDPQLEGDTSLPETTGSLFPSLQSYIWPSSSDFTRGFLTEEPTLLGTVRDTFSEDLTKLFKSWRKQLDLFGNDYYLAHIYRTLDRWVEPTHVTVLGDLLGSQWIDDGEFAKRGLRFWNRVFAGAKRVEERLMDGRKHTSEELGSDPAWRKRVINVAGNHDIGYAGDITRERIDRFERMFGRVNWDIRFTMPNNNDSELTPELHIVVLNDMNLDAPAYDHGIAKDSYTFLNEKIISTLRPVDDEKAVTVLLTHIPLFKVDGVCVDGPLFEFGPTGIREQNHLSERSSRAILDGVFGVHSSSNNPSHTVGRNGVILTGHDHEGCDVYHHFAYQDSNADSPRWAAERWSQSNAIVEDNNIAGIREITVRSMMGSFGGNAGLLSAWFDNDAGTWRIEYSSCKLGVQHIWWAVHVVDVITLLLCICAAAAKILESLTGSAYYPASYPISEASHVNIRSPVRGAKDIGNAVFASSNGSGTGRQTVTLNGANIKRRKG